MVKNPEATAVTNSETAGDNRCTVATRDQLGFYRKPLEEHASGTGLELVREAVLDRPESIDEVVEV